MFPLAVVAGLAVGIARGGRPRSFRGLTLHRPAVIWAAIALQLLLGLGPARSLPEAARFGVVATSYALAGGWVALNAARHRGVGRAAFAVLAAGWLLNVAAILPNGGMPVSLAAYDAAGLPAGEAVSEGHLWKHVAATGDTTLRVLGDVIPVAPLRAVISIGDVLLLVGIAMLVATATSTAGGTTAGGNDQGAGSAPAPWAPSTTPG